MELQTRPGEVLVGIHAIGVNSMEIDVGEGLSGFRFPLPHAMGSEGTGQAQEFLAGRTAFGKVIMTVEEH